MARTSQHSDLDIIEALERHGGKAALAAQSLGITPRALYYRAEKCEGIREAIESAKEVQLDKAEQKLAEAIERGEAWAICFFLKTQGKKRGYTERHEVQAEGHQTRTITIGVELPEAMRQAPQPIEPIPRDWNRLGG